MPSRATCLRGQHALEGPPKENGGSVKTRRRDTAVHRGIARSAVTLCTTPLSLLVVKQTTCY